MAFVTGGSGSSAIMCCFVVSRNIPAGVIAGVTGAKRFFVLLQKTSVVYPVLYLQVMTDQQ